MNLIPAEVTQVVPEGVQVRLPNGSTVITAINSACIQPGDSITLGIRPDHVTVGGTGILTGRIALVEELGEHHLLYTDTDDGARLIARAPGDAKHEIGDAISLAFSGKFCHLFKSSGETIRSVQVEQGAGASGLT